MIDVKLNFFVLHHITGNYIIVLFKNNLTYKLFIYKSYMFNIRGSLNKFPDFFRMGTFIDSTHMKL